MILLVIIGYILLIFLILLLAILFMPIIFHIHAIKTDSLYLLISIHCFFYAVSFNLEKKGNEKLTINVKVFGIRIPVKVNESKEKERKKAKKEGKYNYKYLLNKAFLKKIFQLIKKVLKHISPRRLKIRLKYGFDNPADTGILHGFITMFSHYFSEYDVKLTPVFDREIMEGEVFLKGRIFICAIVCYVLQVAISKTFRSTMKKIKKK